MKYGKEKLIPATAKINQNVKTIDTMKKPNSISKDTQGLKTKGWRKMYQPMESKNK